MKRLAAYFMFAGALFAVPGIAAAQDLAAGEASFHNKCRACHAVGVGVKNTLGPELNGLVGRQAGTAEGYQYSPAGKNAGFAWDQTSFAAFITNPRGKIPGNKMAFAGIKDETEIANLWAYISRTSMSTVAQSDDATDAGPYRRTRILRTRHVVPVIRAAVLPGEAITGPSSLGSRARRLRR